MMYNLNIDNGVEVELKHDLKCMLHGEILRFEFRFNEGIAATRSFLMPYHYDELVPFLFDISLTKTIARAFGYTQVFKGQTYLSAYEFHLVTSPNHQTNITPEFIETVSMFNDIMKRTTDKWAAALTLTET